MREDGMDEVTDQDDGLRARKRRDTLERITEAGLRLFIEQGFEATTLDAIAEASGISRRTFFAYFKSKDEVLLGRDGSGFAEALRPALLAQPADLTPLETLHHCFLELASRYESDESIVVDRILRSTEALRQRKEALFVAMESQVAETLYRRWPQPERRPELRMAAMIGMGTLRLAIEAWRQDEGARPLADHIAQGFLLLETIQEPGT